MSNPKKTGDNSKKLSNLPNNIKLGTKFSHIEGILPTKPEIRVPINVVKEPETTQVEDGATNDAIDDIVVNESNQVLAAEDALDRQEENSRPKKKKSFSVNKLFKNKWLYILVPIFILIALFALPYSRYKILGLFLSNNYQFSLVDKTTNSPIGGATISIAGHSLTTDASGKAVIKLHLGKHSYSIGKHLYKTSNGIILVGLLKSNSKPIALTATGRQIAIQLTNKLTGKPVIGAIISILNTSSITNSVGQTDIVLPTQSEAYLATISASGFNKQTTSVSIKKKINSYSMVPSGSLFFLTNSNNIINVVKTNIDGSDPQIEVAGTGHETASTTSLSISPDWKYLLLEANRSGTQPELYIVDSSTGTVTEFDSSLDQFTLIGWNEDKFIYDEINQSQATSLVGREQIKSYDASNARLSILDQDQVNSTSSGYVYQTFASINLISNEVVYYTNWITSGTYDNSTLTSTIRGVQVSGVNKNDLQSFATPTVGTVSVVKNSPASLFFSVPDTQTNVTGYFQYTNGTVSADSSLNPDSFTKTYPNYYLSPSGSQSLWTQTLNTNQQTFIGDQNGQNQKQVNVLSGSSAYSWYDNVFILLTKSTQLYIQPADASFAPTLVGSYMPSAS